MIYINKIAILGGTFNPPHIGHLLLAENAVYDLGVDKVIFMTAGMPPHKEIVESAKSAQRHKMVKLLIKDNENLAASDFELKINGPCYTAHTLQRIKEKNPDAKLYFIVGLDSFCDFEKWYRPDLIFQTASVAVSLRGGFDAIRLEEAKLYFENKYNAEIIKIMMPEIEISSSEIRKRVRSGRSIKYMTTRDVEEYIYKNNLYKDDVL